MFGKLNKFEKTLLIVLLILSVITIISNIVHYKNFYSVVLIGVVLLFNLSFFVLVVWFVEKIWRLTGKKSVVFVCFCVLAFLLYWYLISGIFNFLYGSFISIGGLLFFSGSVGFLISLLCVLGSLFAVYKLSVLFFMTYKKSFKKDVVRRKRYIVVALIFLILIIVFVPRGNLDQTNPYIRFLKGFVKPDFLNNNHQFISDENRSEILDIDLTGKKMNIVFVLLESVSQDHLSYYGYERNVTPNIDKIAKEGVVFMNARSSASHSNHAQPTILSSRHTLTNKYGSELDKVYPRTFIWGILKEEGYDTFFISSQNERWFNMEDYYNKTNLDLFWHSLTDGKVDYPFESFKKDYDENTILKVIEQINLSRQKGNRFFVYTNLQAMHYPYVYPENNSVYLPDEYSSILTNYLYIPEKDFTSTVNKYDNSLYYADKSLGLLFDYLGKEALIDETLIIIAADHGENFNDRRGLIRHGYGVYEEEVKIPLIFRIPGTEHREIEEDVRLIDVVPTVLDMFNFSQSENFQGEIMKANPITFIYTQNQYFKIGLVKDDIKYVLDLNAYSTEAYNLSEDPYEYNNLITGAENREYYAENYGYILFNWYECQLEYYAEELWKKGELIDC